jgi:hypothetical protein
MRFNLLRPSHRSGAERASLSGAAGQSIRVRRGFALFMALGALVIIAVLVAGSTFITTQEARLGQNQLVQSRAMAAAEYGLNKIQADWDKTPNLTMAIGAIYDTNYTITNQGTSKVRYVRLNNETFWLISEGRATVGNSVSAARTAVKRVGAILRLRIPTIKANGAITTAGNVKQQGSSQIRGANTNPPGWNGCASAPDKAALVVGPTATVTIQKAASVTGSPQTTVDALASDSNTYVRFGDETWTALVAGANIIMTDGGATSDGVPSVLGNGACDKGNVNNWGEPWFTAQHAGAVTACNTYFPIIYATTSVALHGGRGQGIMLVNGDFRANGVFEWYGIIIAKDDIAKSNGNAKVYGAMMARNAETADPLAGDFTGTLDMFYSACSLERAMRGSAQVLQARERAWTELY